GLQLAAALQLEVVGVLLGEHDEQGEVEGIDTLAEDGPLPATLSSGLLTLAEEGAGVLEIVAVNEAAERLSGRQRLAVAARDLADLALRHGDERDFVDPILPTPQAVVNPAAEQVNLEAGLAVERDDAALGHRAARGPQAFDDADAGVRD